MSAANRTCNARVPWWTYPHLPAVSIIPFGRSYSVFFSSDSRCVSAEPIAEPAKLPIEDAPRAPMALPTDGPEMLAPMYIICPKFKNLRPEEIISFILKHRQADVKPDDLASALWMFAQNGGRKELPGLSDFLAMITPNVGGLSSRGLAMVLSGIAKFKVDDNLSTALVASLCSEVRRKAPEFEARHVAHVLSAVAKLQYGKEVVEAMCAEAKKKARHFTDDEVAITLKAVAKLKHYDKELLDTMCSEASTKAARRFARKRRHKRFALVPETSATPNAVAELRA